MDKEKIGFLSIFSLLVLILGCFVYSFFVKDVVYYATVERVDGDKAYIKVIESDEELVIYNNGYSENDVLKIVYDDSQDMVKQADIVRKQTSTTTEEVIVSSTSKIEETSIITSQNSTSTTNVITTTRNTTTTTSIRTTTIRTTTKAVSTITSNYTYTEDNLISDLTSTYSLVEGNKGLSDYAGKAKELLITLVDFIFYDKDIKGIKFKDLTTSAKVKIISLALKVDGLIDKYFPSYKENIASKYTSVKEKLIGMYLDYTATVCTDHSSDCKLFVEDFKILKTSLNITWDVIKNISAFSVEKIKIWYEIFSGKVSSN